jgi:hypothetical protein
VAGSPFFAHKTSSLITDYLAVPTFAAVCLLQVRQSSLKPSAVSIPTAKASSKGFTASENDLTALRSWLAFSERVLPSDETTLNILNIRDAPNEVVLQT